MAAHNELGKLGEQLASRFLIKQGYQVLECNWRFSRAEIDLILMQNDILVFCEVKSRRNISFGKPEAFVNEKKEALMFDAANAYIEESNHQGEIRFDIISVTFDSNEKPKIEHFKDAFFSGL